MPPPQPTETEAAAAAADDGDGGGGADVPAAEGAPPMPPPQQPRYLLRAESPKAASEIVEAIRNVWLFEVSRNDAAQKD